MAKFGKQIKVNDDMSNYIIGVVAPSGFGKSTLMKSVAEKLYGETGYICADFGQEDGYSAIDGAIVEKCPNWKHFKEMVDDIVKNKETDYPNLRVIIWDTLDAAFEIAEKFSVDSFNREHLGEQNFRPASSINSCDGGFGNGLTRCINVVKKEIDRLKSVNVGCWFTAHCKERDQTDLFTGATYTQLTASLTNKYFGSIQNISHVIGFGYFSREMQHIEVGSENPVTKKKKSREEVTKEERRIRFRDSDYVCAAKSRFAEIEPEINLNCDEFIEAIQNAIKAAGSSNGITSSAPKKTTKKSTPKPAPVEDPEENEIDKEEDSAPFDIDEPEVDELQAEIDNELAFEADIDALKAEIRVLNKSTAPEKKKPIVAHIKKLGGLDAMSVYQLLEVKAMYN